MMSAIAAHAWILDATEPTLTAALCIAIVALSGVIVTLWVAYNRSRTRYENLLRSDRDELVPQMLQLAAQAATLNANAEKLLTESIRLRGLWRRRRGDADDDDSEA